MLRTLTVYLFSMIVFFCHFSAHAEKKPHYEQGETIENTISRLTISSKISDRRRRIGNHAADFYALERIENININDADVTLFLSSGPQKK